MAQQGVSSLFQTQTFSLFLYTQRQSMALLLHVRFRGSHIQNKISRTPWLVFCILRPSISVVGLSTCWCWEMIKWFQVAIPHMTVEWIVKKLDRWKNARELRLATILPFSFNSIKVNKISRNFVAQMMFY